MITVAERGGAGRMAVAGILIWLAAGCGLPLSHACNTDRDCLTGQCVGGICREHGSGGSDGALPDHSADADEHPDTASPSDGVAPDGDDAGHPDDAGSDGSDGPDGSADEREPSGEILAWATWPMPNPPFIGFLNRVPSGLPNPQSFEYTPDASVVLDRVTGLSWQRYPEDASFDLQSAREHCAGLVLDDHDDWRLPSRIELISLLDYTTVRDTQIDLAAFPGATGGEYWTGSLTPNPTLAWNVDFGIGVVSTEFETARFRVRCVRRPVPQGVLPQHYDLSENGSVRDNWTGLTWQRAAPTQLLNGYDAITYCRTLPPAGSWRLPSVRELSTVVSESTPRALDTAVFPEPEGLVGNVVAATFWTSSWYDNNMEDSFEVNFFFGATSWDSNSSNAFRARCVR